MNFKFFLFTLLFPLCISGQAGHAELSAKVKMLYNSLDPSSIPEHLALYQLYSNYPEGKLALHHAYALLTSGSKCLNSKFPTSPLSISTFSLIPTSINGIISLVNALPQSTTPNLNQQEIDSIQKLTAFLPHRKLKGHFATSEEEILALPIHEIDLARGLLISDSNQKNGNSPDFHQIYSYEAVLDLMALQILTKVPLEASPKAKIDAINTFIFEEMGFRFPPHSIYAKEIDLYTFLPSVLDSRKGVCLGISLLYICLAQRLGLNLEMVTPPGHIFVRYKDAETEINIETTARGVNLPSEEYLGINNRALQHRNIKELIGLAHFNQASVFWQKQEFDQVLNSYQRAKPYMSNDKFLDELMGYALLLNGHSEEGLTLLESVKDYLPEFAVAKESNVDDVLSGAIDVEGLKTVFLPVDETRASILAKKEALEKVLEKHPRFRAGLLQLATTWIQLHRNREALESLEKYHALDTQDPTVEYYLAVLYSERLDFNQAWVHLKQAEGLVEKRNHHPKVLKQLRIALTLHCPEP